MSECKFYENLNGVKGLCKCEPPKVTDDGWGYPLVEKGCHCRFYDDGKFDETIVDVGDMFTFDKDEVKALKEFLIKNKEKPEVPAKRVISEDVKTPAQLRREKALANKKAKNPTK